MNATNAPVIPWPELVAMHKQDQESLLATIDLYEKSLSNTTDAEARARLEVRINFYKRQYLGLP